MVKNSNGREAMALARSTTMAPLYTAPVLAGNGLHPKLMMKDGRPMTTTEVHNKLTSPEMPDNVRSTQHSYGVVRE